MSGTPKNDRSFLDRVGEFGSMGSEQVQVDIKASDFFVFGNLSVEKVGRCNLDDRDGRRLRYIPKDDSNHFDNVSLWNLLRVLSCSLPGI